ncbi:cytochrome P450 [Desarmillaria tabescens]|uniref:Cytochrome P450 n=1 Tax=Armillaria tabescens TaxID=1929756 RepID=A0AA39JU41_ARMTA|nr:cytochrome P450 [Desarmillaria tabescens]KAK0448941.1 cytochrome P450 [Desarmillaria tabescens]
MAFEEYIDIAQQMDNTTLLRSLAIATALFLPFQLRKALIIRAKLKAIPTVGSSGIIMSWIDTFKFVHHAKEIIEEGHRMYGGSTFKVPLLDKWVVVVSGPDKINDIRKSSREHLSSLEVNIDALQTDYTIDRSLTSGKTEILHVSGIPHERNLCRAIANGGWVSRVKRDQHRKNYEVRFNFRSNSDGSEFGMIGSLAFLTVVLELCSILMILDVYPIIYTYNSATVVVAADYGGLQRATETRDEIEAAFKGNIPMTEDWIEVPAYQKILQIVCRTTNRMFVGLPLCRNSDYLELNINFTINVFICAQIINLFPTLMKPIVGSIITPRRRAIAKTEKFLAETIQERRTVRSLSARMLLTNVAAIHTTSNTFTSALYALAAHPEYVEMLRTEVETVIKEEGKTKAAMGKMNQLDSFLKESQRLYGDIGVFAMRRLAKKDFVFSDGIVIPAGCQVAVDSMSTHFGEENYEHPLEFKPWRFSEKRKREGDAIRHQMALISYVLMNYDVKMDKVPPTKWVSSEQFPSQSSKVLFRKRVIIALVDAMSLGRKQTKSLKDE